MRTSPKEPYLITYQDGGANTSVVKEWGLDGCVTATVVYRVFVNGSWRLVESQYADNYDPTQPALSNGCLQITPNVCDDFLEPQYMCPPPGPSLPPTPTRPTAEATGPGAVRVTWDEPGSCQPEVQDYCGYFVTCAPGFYCEVTEPNGDGTCKFENPAPCSNPSGSCACPQGGECVCESRAADIAGYYIYAGDQDAKQYHFKPATPVAATDSGTRSFTFNALAPRKADSTTNAFHFRIATFDVSGRISELSEVSNSVTPQDLPGPPPAPGSVKTVIWTQTAGPAPGRPAIKVAWLPGGTYTNLIGYRLWRSDSATGTFCALIYDAAQQALVCRPRETLGATEVSTKSIDDTVVENTTYYYKVTALDAAGESPDSAVVAARALPRPEKPLSPPASLRAFAPVSTASFSGINLHWCPNPASEGVTKYRVYRSTTPRGPYLKPDASGPRNLIAVIHPYCLNGTWRCAIGAEGQVTETQNCLGQTNARTCVVVDTTVDQATASNQPVYYYVVTATRPDGQGGIEESPFSEENEGRPNRLDLSVPSFDPDAAPEVFCGDEFVRRNGPGDAIGEALADLGMREATQPSASFQTDGTDRGPLAPYRVIGQEEEPPPWDPEMVDLPEPDAVPRFVYLHLDHLGSPRVSTDDSGAVVSEHHYMPFGEEMPYVAQNSTNKRQFTGHERDTEINSDYMVARYYSTGLQRFVTVDPTGRSVLGFKPQTWNRYSYVYNNPLLFTDPNGQNPILIGIGVAIGVGALAVLAYDAYEYVVALQAAQEGAQKYWDGTLGGDQDKREEGLNQYLNAVGVGVEAAVDAQVALEASAARTATVSRRMPELLEKTIDGVQTIQDLLGAANRARTLPSRVRGNYTITVTVVRTYHQIGSTLIEAGPPSQEVFIEGLGALPLLMGEYGTGMGQLIRFFQNQGMTVYVDGIEQP